MKTTIEAIKDEVAKKHGFNCWCNEIANEILINETIHLYHQRKCEEAGRELPDVNFVPHDKQYDSNEDGANWMKGFAIKLLASLQSQLEAKEQELKESVDCTEHMKEVCDNYQKVGSKRQGDRIS